MSFNRYVISGDYMSKALNDVGSSYEEVNVLKWFDKFWVYVSMTFQQTYTQISVSVFYGDTQDLDKNQLFRCEWDDYNDSQVLHPQPHWHFKANSRTINKFEDMVQQEGFVSEVKNSGDVPFDIGDMHFAMSANWMVGGKHVTQIGDSEVVLNWFQGLLAHLKEQLVYISR
ncbi:MAG: hypothetical protein JJ975_14290 [Bacteroidia bacterium]|nr:hypothetical protein [Bacteroidia bacterium]